VIILGTFGAFSDARALYETCSLYSSTLLDHMPNCI
jgi:hypothetical protein